MIPSFQSNILNKRNSSSKEEFQDFLKYISSKLDQLTLDEMRQLDAAMKEIALLEEIELAKTDFLTFVKLVKPELKFSSRGMHHRMASVYQRLIDGDLKRVTVSMAPREGKSEFGSICLPAWTIGKNPTWKIMQASASEGLAKDFGRKTKTIVDSPMFRRIFPNVLLSRDSKSNSKFATNFGGEYHAVGTNTGIAGKGADLFVLDDIVNEQDAKTGKDEAFDAAWNWFLEGPQQRLQPGGRIVLIATRWSKSDPIGRIEKRSRDDPKTDKYEKIVIPVCDEDGHSMFPEMWSDEAIAQTKANTPPHIWDARYMQDPKSMSGVILPRSYWKPWRKYRQISEDEVEYTPPDCTHTLLSIDTAYTKNKRSNPNAFTIWGLFEYDDPESGSSRNCLILLHSFQKKMEFSECKRVTKELIDEWQPDSVIIEAKNIGPALMSELRQAGVSAQPVNPKPGEDKAVRLISVADIFASGNVFYMPTRSNEATINQCADFPSMDGDDLVDTVSYAAGFYRKRGLLKTVNDKVKKPVDNGPVSRKWY